MLMLKAALVLSLVGSVLAGQQQPLGLVESLGSKDELLRRLTDAEIIPQLIDAFVPIVNLSIHWENATVAYGNTVSPSELQEIPVVKFLPWSDRSGLGIDELAKKHKLPQLTLALTDPDAPSYDDPKWSQVCHWLATHPPFKIRSTSKSYTEIVEYKPPGPPPKTGLHRYVFIALAPLNGTTKKLHLSTPKDRQHWGYDGDRAGVREWAVENGLGVIGANFIYAQNAKQ